MVKEAGKGLILVVSKWDLIKDENGESDPFARDRIAADLVAERGGGHRAEVAAEARAADGVAADVDAFFTNLLPSSGDGREPLFEAMRHAAIGGGKRLRPLRTR